MKKSELQKKYVLFVIDHLSGGKKWKLNWKQVKYCSKMFKFSKKNIKG